MVFPRIFPTVCEYIQMPQIYLNITNPFNPHVQHISIWLDQGSTGNQRKTPKLQTLGALQGAKCPRTAVSSSALDKSCMQKPCPRHPGPPKLRFGMTGPQKHTDQTPPQEIFGCLGLFNVYKVTRQPWAFVFDRWWCFGWKLGARIIDRLASTVGPWCVPI